MSGDGSAVTTEAGGVNSILRERQGELPAPRPVTASHQETLDDGRLLKHLKHNRQRIPLSICLLKGFRTLPPLDLKAGDALISCSCDGMGQSEQPCRC